MGKIDWVNTFYMILVIVLILFISSWFFGFKILNYSEIKKQRIINNPIFNTNQDCEKVMQDCRERYHPLEDGYCKSYDSVLEKKCSVYCGGKGVELFQVFTYKNHECKNGELICECQ